MKHQRTVTEADFRLPEFRTAKIEDYELRPGDDKPVRKDRWQNGILQIASAVGLNTRQGFEVSQVVEAVELLTQERHSWDYDELPKAGALLDIKLADGTILVGVESSNPLTNMFVWRSHDLEFATPIVAWRESAPVATADE